MQEEKSAKRETPTSEARREEAYRKIHDIAFGKSVSIGIARDETAIARETTKKDIVRRETGGVDIAYWGEMENRLKATDSFVRHPRTGELIIGTSGLENKRIPRRKTPHLRACPRVPYKTRINARLCNGAFVLRDGKLVWRPNVRGDRPLYERTTQYRTVWLSKGMRRQ